MGGKAHTVSPVPWEEGSGLLFWPLSMSPTSLGIPSWLHCLATTKEEQDSMVTDGINRAVSWDAIALLSTAGGLG